MAHGTLDAQHQVDDAPTFAELWQVLVPFWGGGLLALVLGLSSLLRDTLLLERLWLGPLLLSVGAFVCGHAMASLQEKLRNNALRRAVPETLHAGQFTFVLLGLIGLAIVTSALLAVTFLGVVVLGRALGAIYPWMQTVLPWCGGLFLAAGAMWVWVLPFHALYRWFGARQSLQRMRDEALFAFATSHRNHSG